MIPNPDARKADLKQAFRKTVDEDPEVLHARLRRECPVALQEADGETGLNSGWLVTRYEDIAAVAADPETFGQAIRWPEQRRPPLKSNPPEHRAFRALMQPFFMPASLAALEPVSRAIAVELIEPLIAAGGGDVAHDLARPLPPQVLLARLGQPTGGWPPIKEACEAAYLQGSSDPDDIARYNAGNDLLWDYSRAVVADRKANPRAAREDLVSAMLAGQIDGVPVEEGLIVGMVRLVLAAGHDSTTSALGICLRFLAENPKAQARLRETPKMIAGAVEEILRLQAPVLKMPRRVCRDTELGGRQLKTGDKVLLVFASGNRDDEAFEQADEFIVDRMPNRHMSFGVGPHVCIGNGLARQEIRVALEELLARTAAFTLAEEPEREFWHPYGATRLVLEMTGR